MIVDVVGGILLAGLTLYAALGGADFGGGLWDLLAGGDRRGRAPRQLIDDTITPVWEANHVWLIFSLVIFWTAFPAAFAAVMTAAALPRSPVPALLPGTELTLASGAAPHSILVTVVVVFITAAILVGPSFLLLFSLHGRQLLEGESHAEQG